MKRTILRERVRRSRLLAAVSGAIVATVVVSMGLAYAQTDGGDVYTGCLSPGGAVTNIAIGDEPLKPCTGTKIAISWNQTGPEGPDGPPGPTGDTGPEGPQGEAGAGQDEIDEIRADLDALLEVVQVDSATGAVTLVSPNDLILDSGDSNEVVIMDDAMLEGDTTLMEDATVMGETMLEGDTMLMEDATVVGETMLEGDTMLMEDAKVMGDATFEASVVLADSTTTVVDGVLTPTSSSTTVTGFDGFGFLGRITPAAVDGTILEIHFGTLGPPVVSCFGGCTVPLGAPNNIALKGLPAWFYEVGDTLKLVSDGLTWVEVSRSSGHAEAFNVTEKTQVFPGTTRSVFLQCSDGPESRDDALLLTASVNLLDSTDLVVDREQILVFAGSEEAFSVVVSNTASGGGFVPPQEFDVALRCLSI